MASRFARALSRLTPPMLAACGALSACQSVDYAYTSKRSNPAATQKDVSGSNSDKSGTSDSLHPNLTVVDSKAIRCLFTIIRDENTVHLDFSQAADRLMRILAEEGLASLPSVHPVTVRTPCGYYQGLASAPAGDVAVVSIVRAGDTLLEAVRRVNPGVAVGKILIQRDESTAAKSPRLFYVKLPPQVATQQVLLVDPMLATGQSAAVAIDVLVERGVSPNNIVFLNVVSCPEGLSYLASKYPQVKVVTCAIDDRLNEAKYIVPGLGDFGDRYMGTDIPAPRKTKPPPAHLHRST